MSETNEEEPGIRWPDLPQAVKNDPQLEFKKELYQAQLDELKAKQDAFRQEGKDTRANDYTRAQALYSAYLDVAKEQIGRAQTRATFIQTAATAIGTIYTGVLALAYGLSSQPATLLTIKGVIPALFLGLAIVLAAVYLSYITDAPAIKPSIPSGLISIRLEEERNDFITWTSQIVLRRIPWLHGAIISLGFGILFLPIAFLTISDTDIKLWIFVVVCIIILILIINWPTVVHCLSKVMGRE
jgi:hypothetical protein